MHDNLLRYSTDKLFVFIDLETENLCLNFCHNRPWQCGMLKVKGNQEIDSRDIYIKWDKPIDISDGAAIVTHFNPSKYNQLAIHSSKTFETIYEWLMEADYIIGHNLFNFDLYLLREYFKMYGKNWKPLIPKIIDTLCLSKSVKYEIPYTSDLGMTEWQYKIGNEWKKGIKTSLSEMAKYYNIEFDPNMLHEATFDLRLNLQVWNKLKYQIAI